MDARLTRVAVVAAAVLGVALASGAALSQTSPAAPATPSANDTGGPPPVPPINSASAGPSGPIVVQSNAVVAPVTGPLTQQPATNAVTPPPAAPPKPTAPPGPPLPVRAPTAVLQVLDKITAETLAFEAPVGKPIRYKTLVFTVKVCETRGLDEAQPRPSAFVVINSRALAVPGHAPPPAKQVFSGWMFANGPALHPFEHPIYDAWLISCSAAAPPA